MALQDWQIANLRDAAIAAVGIELKYSVPPEVIVGQWADESGWGKHQPGNNPFGIKTYANDPNGQLLKTYEWENGQRVAKVQWFKVFPDLEAAFERLARLLTLGEKSSRGVDFRAAWANYNAHKDWRQWVREFAPVYCTYAGYADDVIAIGGMKIVQACITAAATSILSASLEQKANG